MSELQMKKQLTPKNNTKKFASQIIMMENQK